ncbi:hypothetical protein ACQUQQ_08690 [Acidithiobacillus ferrooxidans]|uniref:hypothetical protein n=1 Tax=Acidithiobacillus ferrooxidans TaxID=920 RepID=UPI000A43F920
MNGKKARLRRRMMVNQHVESQIDRVWWRARKDRAVRRLVASRRFDATAMDNVIAYIDAHPECLDRDIETGGIMGEFNSSTSDMPFIDGIIYVAGKGLNIHLY